MKSAIEQMCLGIRGTYENVHTSEKYNKIMGKVCQADKNLIEKLKEDREALELFCQFKDVIDEASCEECETFYKEGFKFGVLLGIDISDE